MSDDEISSTFVLQLMTSVSHTVLVRMGINPAAIFHGDEYESITLFNSPDTISVRWQKTLKSQEIQSALLNTEQLSVSDLNYLRQ